MSKKVLFIGTTKAKATRRLQEEALLQHVVFDVISTKSFENTFSGTGLVVENESTHKLSSYDVYFFRGLGHRMSEMQKRAVVLAEAGKRVVERCFPLQGFPEDKIVSPSGKSQYAILPSQVISPDAARKEAEGYDYPLVLKGLTSSKGKSVKKILSSGELIAQLASTQETVLLQKYYDIEFDTRVLVVGGKVLGGLHRYRKSPDDFLTTARGGVRIKAELTHEQIEAAIEAVALQGLEIAGVDMFTAGGKVHIIEVNSSPQFHSFEKHTGVNVAREIISYIAG